MNNAVIYARYSSAGQNEQSIEGQLRICKEHAENKGLTVLKTYVDKARTGTNDNRPDFQRMLADAERGNFQFIIVYKFDRFARNRFDSMMHKQTLKKQFNIRVISALEPVSDDEGGEIYEMFLEWNDEKYSKRLSRRVRDGLDTSVANGTFCGGHLAYGYKKNLQPIAGKADRFIKTVGIDEEQAEVIRYIFTEYSSGVSKEHIAAALNAKGYRYNGKPFLGRTFDNWLVNEKYTGVFRFGDRLCDNMYPAIIDRAIFDKAQELLKKNKYFAKSNAPRIPFFLTGKAYCGHCGTPMIADGGTSHTGTTYNYYVCKTARKNACDKKREDKNDLEKDVTEITVNYLRNPKRVQKIADDTIAHHARRTDTSILKSLETRMANTQKEMKDTTTAYIQAVATKNALFETACQERMQELTALLEDLKEQQLQIEIERGAAPTHKKIVDFVAEFIDGDISDKDFQKRIIGKLVNSVYVYNRSVIYFSFDSGEKIFISKGETDAAIEKTQTSEGSGSVDIGGGNRI